MERVKSRSESPFSHNKGKIHSSNGSENGSRINEQVKGRKKNLRSKNKHQLNGKDVEDSASNGQDKMEEEQGTSNEIDNNVDSSNTEYENEVNGVNNIENGNSHEQVHETNENGNGHENEKEASNIICEVSKEVDLAQDNNEPNEGVTREESESTEEEINVDENSSDEVSNQSKIETESNANNDILQPVIETFDEKCNQGTNNIVKTETNGINQEQESTEEEDTQVEEASEIGLNGSDDCTNNEKTDIIQNQVQASPDTVSKEEYSLQSKITSFFGKLTYSPEQKQDSEISSSKKIENTNSYHPYLSQVSGRRGIKERLNSSATVFSSTEHVVKTPETVGVSFDDSFRVRTNPPRLNSADLNENPTLRKFKAKRCLNDEPEEGEDAYLSTIKRRKLDEKTQESGILGSILWSPFKKRSLDNENQLKIDRTESKLSRLLSPFWFWKKATEGQNRK